MKELSKKDLERKAELEKQLKEAREAVELGAGKYNDVVQALWDDTVEARITELNALIEGANEFMQEIVDSQTEYIEKRSESWKDSNRGQDYMTWCGSWRDFLEDFNLDQPPLIELEEISFEDLDRFAALTDEPDWEEEF